MVADMDVGLSAFLVFAGAAAIASPLGGWLGLRLGTGSLFLSISVGLAGGVLLGTFSFEMMPAALEAAGRTLTVAGFVFGFASVYAIDMLINRGFMAGRESDEWHTLSRIHRNRRARSSKVTLLAAGTSVEEIIEGLSIGVALATDPTLGAIIVAAIILDNLVEGISIAEIIRAENPERASLPTYAWTSIIGLALFSSATIGWFFLSEMPQSVVGSLLALGAGGMFYLTITDLLPKSERAQYQQSAAVSVAIGFLVMFVLSSS
jgi:ZIP family zinc transporter